MPRHRLLPVHGPWLRNVVLLGLAWVCLGAGKFGSLEDPADRVLETQLGNGLTVLSLEDHTTPVVSFQIWVKVGSKDESRYTGLAHLFEHMMFKGSANVAPEIHARLIEGRGGRINAFTSRDVTVYFEDVTAESLPLVIDLEAERFQNLQITERTLASERQVVLEERRLRTEDSPEGRAFEALAALAWRSNTYRRPVIGWKEDVEQVPVAACQRFFDDYYVPNNMIVVVVGDFETEATLAQIRRAFGPLQPAAQIPRNPIREPDQRGERRTVIEYDLQSPILLAAWHAPAAGHPDAEALDVASEILSAGRSSRLYRALVYEAEAALYAYGGYWELKNAGLFYASAGVRPGVPVERVESLFFEEIARMQKEGVLESEVAKAKRQLEVALVEGLTTSHSVAARIGQEMAVFGRVRPLAERMDAVRRVTAEDVQRVMRTYLRADKRSVVHVVPPVAREGDASEGGLP